jgi:TPP-dependent pyruvate/acetoin dehydrogenase alpha subunit
VDDKLRLEIYRKMLLARRLEERIRQLSMSGEMPATLHPGVGQEGCQIAALAALRPDDPMLYGHRGVGYWIARELPIERILCDIECKEGGTNRGKGGVMHVVDPSRGILGESGTLGGNFVLGVGVALAEKFQRTGRLVVMFFGDGTSNRGQFHEAANFAAVKRLPCLFFCENNGWAVSVPARVSTAVENIADRAGGYGMRGVIVDGSDVEAVHAITADVAAQVRAGGGPALIEAKVVRLGPHFLGDPEHYRSRAEVEALQARDPLPKFQQALEQRGVLSAAHLAQLEDEIRQQIDAAVEFARRQPLVAPPTARENVYAS